MKYYVTAHSSEREIQLLPRGLNIYQDKTNDSATRLVVLVKWRGKGTPMSLDQLGPREPKMQFFWISFSRTVCDVAKLGHGKNCCRDPWRTICAFFVTPYATLKTYWTPNGVTVCYYSSGVEVESLAHRQTRSQAKKRDIIFLIHSDTHKLIHTWWRRNGMWDLVKDGT